MTRTPSYDYDLTKIKNKYDEKPTLRSVALKLGFHSQVFTRWFRRNIEIETNTVFIVKKTGERI